MILRKIAARRQMLLRKKPGIFVDLNSDFFRVLVKKPAVRHNKLKRTDKPQKKPYRATANALPVPFVTKALFRIKKPQLSAVFCFNLAVGLSQQTKLAVQHRR